MITNIPDRERDLQAQVDALTEELASVEASNRIRGDELARLRAVEPVAPPGWREALQFYADRSHFVIADADAWDTVSGEPSNFWCDNGTATVEDGTVAKMALAGTPLSDEDDDGAAPPAQPAEQQAQTVCKRTLVEIDARLRECSIVGASAADAYDTFYQHMVETALAAQPAEPVQRLSDERAAFEAWHNEYRTQELVRRDDTYYNTHVRCRWEGWQARAIESALQPGWRDIESAPKDGTHVLLWCQTHIQKGVQAMPFTGRWFSGGPWIIVNADMAIQRVEPTHWMALPPAPKATK